MAAPRPLRPMCLLLSALAASSKTRGKGAGDGGWSVGSIPEQLHTSCGIARVNASDLSSEDFEGRFMGANKPVVLVGATEGWLAQKHWKKKVFVRKYGDIQAKMGNSTDVVLFAGGWHFHNLPRTPIADVVEAFGTGNLQGSARDRPFVFDSEEIFRSDRMKGDFATPAALAGSFGGEGKTQTGSAAQMWNVLSLGDGEAGLPFHSHGDAWLALVFGSKHWFLYPPGTRADSRQPPRGQPPHGMGGVWHWATEVFPTLPLAERPIECTQLAGEVMFVPQGWAHATLNIGETVGVGGQLEWGGDARAAHARSVLQRHPHDADAHKDLAIGISTKLGIPQLARNVLRAAFSTRQEGGQTFTAPIPQALLNHTQQLTEAAGHFRTAIELRPYNIPLYKMAADLYIATGLVHFPATNAEILTLTAMMAQRGLALRRGEGPAVAAEIAEQTMASAMDYAMAAVQLGTVGGLWGQVVAGYELVKVIQPDADVSGPLARAQAALREAAEGEGDERRGVSLEGKEEM